MRKRYTIIIGSTVLLALTVGGWLVVRALTRPTVTFYGLVIDERGQPVADATMRLAVMEFHVGPDGLGRQVPGTTNHQSLHTDSSGRFSVHDVPGNNVTILEVSKPGFEWVFDWAYVAGPGRVSNLFYGFDVHDRMYLPDESRPAIFPLHRVGTRVAGRPSRGGSDRHTDGHVVPNDPVTPIVPSAGLGAPANRDERDEWLLKLSGRKRPGSVPTQPTTIPKGGTPDSPL